MLNVILSNCFGVVHNFDLEIIFGFRPEPIELGRQNDAYVVEAGVDPRDTPETDSTITFSIPYGEVCLFDGETENAI